METSGSREGEGADGAAAGGPLGADEDADARALARLGYKQVLLRRMGGFSNFAISFSIISVLTGALTLYGHGLRFGGPFVMAVGWPLVSLMTTFVALSLAELSSAFPTAGALYHWSSILGGRLWGFLTAWLNTVGQFAITAGIDYGLAEMLSAALGLPEGRGTVLAIYAAVLVSHGLFNHVGVRAIDLLSRVSAWVHVLGVVAIVAALAAFAPLRPAGFLLLRETRAADPAGVPYPYAYAFLIGLLQAQWTFTGYDASAHVTEETRDPARNAPRGTLLSVALSAVFGYALILALTLAIPDLDAAHASSSPVLTILGGALPAPVARALTWTILCAIWFCGLASVTSNSRMLFAFARDGGLPASHLLARVSPRFRSPHVAVWVSVGFAFLVAVWSGAYAAMTALSVLALYASYAMPIAAYLRARLRGAPALAGPFRLARASAPVAAIALLWVAFITVLFVLPPNELAGLTFAGALVFVGLDWVLRARRGFAGPPVLAARSSSPPAGSG